MSINIPEGTSKRDHHNDEHNQERSDIYETLFEELNKDSELPEPSHMLYKREIWDENHSHQSFIWEYPATARSFSFLCLQTSILRSIFSLSDIKNLLYFAVLYKHP